MKVLLAEDSATLRTLLASQLRKWNYETTSAVHGGQAWEYFEASNFQLVLTDWVMPCMDGLELIRRIRSTNRPGYVYVVLLTAKTEKDALVQAMEAGADDFLVKPCDEEELRVRLREGERIIGLERRLEEQNQRLREAQASLVQSEKLASVGQLASGMAHEINNPIAFVTNNLAVLKRDVQGILQLLERYEKCRGELQKVAPAAVEEIVAFEQECDLSWLKENLPRLFASSLTGLSRVREVVNNLREFAHLDAATYDEMDIAAALESTLDVLNHELDAKSIKVERNLKDAPCILCRPAKIKQLFHSVLLNAIQASRPGGTIRITAGTRDKSATIDIADDGCGVDQESLTRIFDPFYTTRPVGSGTGLGLAISYGIVRDHGGTISVESQVGQGTIVHMQLPLRSRNTLSAADTKVSHAEEDE